MLGGRAGWCPPSLHVTCYSMCTCLQYVCIHVSCVVSFLCRGSTCPHLKERVGVLGIRYSGLCFVPFKVPFVWRSSTIPALRGLPHVMTLNRKHSYHLLPTTSLPPHKRTTSSYALPSTYIRRSGCLQFTAASLYL